MRFVLLEQPVHHDTDAELAARLERWAAARVRRGVDNKGTALLREAAERIRGSAVSSSDLDAHGRPVRF